MIDDMAVYIANLGKYNEGYLVGAWFTFPIDEEDVTEKIGLNEQYEEWCVIEESQRYLRLEHGDKESYVSYFTVNAIVGELDFPSTDGMTIDDIKQLSNAEIVATVRESLSNYRPKSVRRVFIPKAGSDKMRPLGIPCIWDRLVQQCILQVLRQKMLCRVRKVLVYHLTL